MKHRKLLINGKYVPQRMCSVCRTVQNKHNMIRISKQKNNLVLFDEYQKIGGRGVYCCKSLECIEKAKKNSLFQKNLKVFIPESLYEECLNYV